MPEPIAGVGAEVQPSPPANVVRPQADVLADPLADPLGVDHLANPAENGPGLIARGVNGVKQVGHAIADGASEAWEGTKNVASRAGQAISEGASEAWDATKSAGRAIKKGANYLAEGAAEVGSAIGESAKQGAVLGAGVGALPGLAAGGLAGGALGVAAGEGMDMGAVKGGAAIGGGLVGGATAIVGGLVGGVMGPLVRGVDAFRGDDKGLLEKTKNIPPYHIILEQLAHHYAYGRGDPATLRLWGYEIVGEHEDTNSGFRVVAFAPRYKSKGPDGEPLKGVVAFRGTANAGGAADDANDQGVGTFQFSRNEKEIELVIKKAQGDTLPDATGHSLGGSLAQLAVARFGGLIGNVVTFQSPGINAAEALKVDAEKHKATHYRAKGDVVSDAGEAHVAGELFTFEHKGPNSPLTHLTFPLAELNALRKKHGFDKPIVDGVRSDDDEWKSEGGHHEGDWADAESKTKNRLLKVRHHEDVQQGPMTGISDVASLGQGRKVIAPAHAALGGMSGISDRQSHYAAAWSEIREICMSIQKPTDIPGVRAQVVDLCLKHKVDPKDHGKFISQAEAAMMTALEASPLNQGGPVDA